MGEGQGAEWELIAVPKPATAVPRVVLDLSLSGAEKGTSNADLIKSVTDLTNCVTEKLKSMTDLIKSITDLTNSVLNKAGLTWKRELP